MPQRISAPDVRATLNARVYGRSLDVANSERSSIEDGTSRYWVERSATTWFKSPNSLHSYRPWHRNRIPQGDPRRARLRTGPSPPAGSTSGAPNRAPRHGRLATVVTAALGGRATPWRRRDATPARAPHVSYPGRMTQDAGPGSASRTSDHAARCTRSPKGELHLTHQVPRTPCTSGTLCFLLF